jgi:hypothetical protein
MPRELIGIAHWQESIKGRHCPNVYSRRKYSCLPTVVTTWHLQGPQKGDPFDVPQAGKPYYTWYKVVGDLKGDQSKIPLGH